MMGYALWIPDALRHAGLEPDFVAGWEKRGNPDGFVPQGHINHHTAGGINGVQPSLGICTNGRKDLAGPLCNVFLPREESRRVIVVAAGKANHAGAGNWKGITTNYKLTGVEVEHVGTSVEPLSDLRLDNMHRIAAAMCWGGRFGSDKVAQHREYATPAGRKPDFTKAYIPDGNDFRSRTQTILDQMGGGIILPPPVTVPSTPVVVILRRGSKGNAVRHIQERLNAHSVNDGRLKVKVDGDFGPGTETAVKAFQQDVNLSQDGVVGPVTLQALNTTPNQPAPRVRPTLREGSTGEDVKYLQGRLGLSKDGSFGPKTKAAVKSLQRRAGLVDDGVVGPKTWAAVG